MQFEYLDSLRETGDIHVDNYCSKHEIKQVLKSKCPFSKPFSETRS